MTDPIFYLSMLLGTEGVYVLISSFHENGENIFIILKSKKPLYSFLN